MPYKIKQNGVYVKRGEKWKLLKQYPSHREALVYLRALEINAHKK